MRRRRQAREIGDARFPLEATIPEGVTRDHPHVGRKAEVAPYATESLARLQGKKVQVTGVILKHGQIAGYEVKAGLKTLYGPKKDFFVELSTVEDVHLNSPRAEHIRNLLGHYRKDHDYIALSWDGVESLLFQLAKATETVAVEPGGQYGYPSSPKGAKGQNWRLLVPDHRGLVVVNCHSLFHDSVWTLVTTTYSTREVDREKLRFLGHADHWTRTLVWTLAVANAVGQDDSEEIHKLVERLKMTTSPVVKTLVEKLTPRLERALQEVSGVAVKLNPVSIGFGTSRVEPNHVGRYEHPTDECPYGILTIHPKVWGNQPYLKEVIKHELIHHALGSLPGSRRPHDKLFNAMAKAMGLPKKYRD